MLRNGYSFGYSLLHHCNSGDHCNSWVFAWLFTRVFSRTFFSAAPLALVSSFAVEVNAQTTAQTINRPTTYERVVGSAWKGYKDTESLRAARLFWWFNRAQDANQFVEIVPDETFGQVARITFPSNTGGPGSAPRMMTRLPVPLEKVWFRWRIKFTPGWTTVGPEPRGHANSYKMAFWLWDGHEGRGQVELSNTRQYILGFGVKKPGRDYLRYQETPLPGSQSFGHVTSEWSDGQWYEFIIYYEKTGPSSARQHWWRRRLTDQGRLADLPFIYHGIEANGDTTPKVRAVELGANKNKNNVETMFLSWGPWEVVDGSKYPDPFNLFSK